MVRFIRFKNSFLYQQFKIVDKKTTIMNKTIFHDPMRIMRINEWWMNHNRVNYLYRIENIKNIKNIKNNKK